MTKKERREDINKRYGEVVAERNFQLPGSVAYMELTKILQDIRKEYQNGVYTRIKLVYDWETGHYRGVDTASATSMKKY